MDAPQVSIVIVSYNCRELLRRCLASVYQNTQSVPFDVVVADNASHDGTPELVRAEFPRAALICRTENGGFARGVNDGVAVARGAYLLVLNPDAELNADILPLMLAYLREHDDVGILAPKLLDGDGRLQLSCRAFPGFATALFSRYSLLTRLLPGNRFSRRYLMTDFAHDRIADVDWASAACWLLPRRAYERIGPLDEGYFWSIEDVDYCQRAHAAGLRVVYYPDVSVRHRIGGSSSTAPLRTIAARHRGMWRYYRAYLRPGSPLARPVVDAAVALGIATRWAAQVVWRGLRRVLGA